jgi:amino acid permease
LNAAGPLGLLLAFAIMGAIMWGVLQGAAEMATLVPTAGGFPHFVARFVDPAAGFAVGWTCEYAWAGLVGEEMAGVWPSWVVVEQNRIHDVPVSMQKSACDRALREAGLE